jgi:UDP-4-amino-4,6-dideoxy-N-acetyl-beta-L-altrosamine transaminase
MGPIPYGKQDITSEDIEAVVNILKSDFLTQGPSVKDFEDAFANYVGAKFAVAVSNGTAALHLCALALNVQNGQKVITTPITFVASANCIRYCGGEVVFADIDSETYLLDINYVKKMLAESPRGTYAGIVVVDFAGRSVDLEAYKKLAEEYNLWIIEDACHSPGGFFIDSSGVKQNCGNGVYANLSIFSFHPVKHIACGEGGMITTNDVLLYKQLLRLRSHGITKGDDNYTNSLEFANAEEGHKTYPGWYMEMQQLGFNYRLTDFQAALGQSQLLRANEGILRRRYLASVYEKAFAGQPYILGQSGYIEGHAYHLFVIEVEKRLELYNYLKTKNIFSQVHYIPSHLMPYYRERGWKGGDLPNAEDYYRHCISLPMYPKLTDEEQLFVIDSINFFYKNDF